MTFAIIAFICRWRPAHSKRRGGCAVGPFADALIILTVKHKQISTYLAVKHKQKCLPTGCSRGLNGSAFSRISTAVAQLRVGTQLQDRPPPPVQAHHASCPSRAAASNSTGERCARRSGGAQRGPRAGRQAIPVGYVVFVIHRVCTCSPKAHARHYWAGNRQ